MFNYLQGLDAELKISFEDEGLTLDQIITISSLAHKNNINVNVKVGGCEALTDIRIANYIGSTGCVAPMIESSFALHKFISTIFKNNFHFDNLFINIESRQAYENIESIIHSKDAEHLTGIVLGRSDFVSSYNLIKKDTDSEAIFDKAVTIFSLAKSKGLKTLMGGNLNTNSLNFIKRLYERNLLDYVETRNVKVKLSENFIENYQESLNKMIRFEVEWLKRKSNQNSILLDADTKRISNLELRR